MLRFMGIDEPEQVRCRIYGAEPSDHEREQEARRLALLRRMASPEGAIDGEAIDDAVAALKARGWLADMAMVDNPDGPGRLGVWRLNDRGREALAAYERGESVDAL